MTTPQRPPARGLPPPPPNQNKSQLKVSFKPVTVSKLGHRVLLYGPGGIGKTTLACLLPGKSVFIDADESLGKLKGQLDALDIAPPNFVPCANWDELSAALQSSGWDGVNNLIIDAWPPVELWCLRHTLAKVRKDNNQLAKSIEDYGYGKGYRHNFDTFCQLLSNLDLHIRAGRNVVIIAHDEASKVPNPGGIDFIRWEPKMQNTNNSSIRYRCKEWCDHVLFLTYDIDVTKEQGLGAKGKAKGSGTRTLYTAELPHFMAKSRTTNEPISIESGVNPWPEIIK